jgi:lysophospholipase L1-like esterase
VPHWDKLTQLSIAMKHIHWSVAACVFWIFSSLVFGQAVVAAQRPAVAEAKPIHAVKIILVGDSTAAVHSGWGGSFCALHVTSFVACVNVARNGRSTRSYREEGS